MIKKMYVDSDALKTVKSNDCCGATFNKKKQSKMDVAVIVTDEDLFKNVRDILPKNVTPRHLIEYARQIEKPLGYENQLTMTLKHIANKLKDIENFDKGIK